MEIQMIAAPKASTAVQFTTPNSGSASMRRFQEQTATTWTIPQMVEIAVGLEINSYACAELN